MKSTTKLSASPSFDFCIKSEALKLPEFWADNSQVWFAQTEAHVIIKGVTSSLKFYYCIRALGQSDEAQIVDLIELPYESLKIHLTVLQTLNPFQRYQALMSLPWSPSRNLAP